MRSYLSLGQNIALCVDPITSDLTIENPNPKVRCHLSLLNDLRLSIPLFAQFSDKLSLDELLLIFQFQYKAPSSNR